MHSIFVEAEKIIDIIFDEYGTGGVTRGPIPFINIKSAIKEMNEDKFKFVKCYTWIDNYINQLLTKNKQGSKMNLSNWKNTTNLIVCSDYAWLIQFHDPDSIEDILFIDLERISDVISLKNGIGIIYIEITSNSENSMELQNLYDSNSNLKNKSMIDFDVLDILFSTGHNISEFAIIRTYTYFFDKVTFFKGLNDSWLVPRSKTKNEVFYEMKYDLIPEKYLLFVRNFNDDRSEFEDEFGDPEIYISQNNIVDFF